MPPPPMKKLPARRRKPAARRADPRPLHKEVRLHLGRKSTLLGALSIGDALALRKPRDLGPQVDRAFERMLACCARARAYIMRTVLPQVDLGARRNALVAAIGRIRRMLDVLGHSPSSEQAKRARAASNALLGREGAALLRRAPAQLWGTFGAILEHHREHPALLKRLEALVTPELVAEVFQAHAALGAAIAARRAPKPPEVDVRAFIAELNGLIDHYALCVFATAAPGDAAAMRTALHLLEPIRAERADRSRDLRRKRARKVDAPETPAPAPPTPPRPKRARKA